MPLVGASFSLAASAFVPVRWKLISLHDLQVDLKFEFNQSNRGLYGPDAAKSLLGDGAIQ